MKILSKEYDSNELIDLSIDLELMMKVLSFERESYIGEVESKLRYYKVNKDQEMIDMINNENVVLVIYQDSERDIYIINDD